MAAIVLELRTIKGQRQTTFETKAISVALAGTWTTGLAEWLQTIMINELRSWNLENSENNPSPQSSWKTWWVSSSETIGQSLFKTSVTWVGIFILQYNSIKTLSILWTKNCMHDLCGIIVKESLIIFQWTIFSSRYYLKLLTQDLRLYLWQLKFLTKGFYRLLCRP